MLCLNVFNIVNVKLLSELRRCTVCTPVISRQTDAVCGMCFFAAAAPADQCCMLDSMSDSVINNKVFSTSVHCH